MLACELNSVKVKLENANISEFLFLNDRSDPFFFLQFFLKRNSSSSYGFLLMYCTELIMTLKSCQNCYQVESDTLITFTRTVFQIKMMLLLNLK